MHPGSQQDQRLNPALLAGHFQPDGLSLAQRLHQVLQLARQLRFIDTQGSEAGRWGTALEQDLSMLLAEIAAQPVDSLADGADPFAWTGRGEAWAQCLQRARRLDHWVRLLDDDAPPPEVPIRQRLLRPLQQALATSLGRQLQDLLRAAGAGPAAWAGWHAAWGLQGPPPAAGTVDRGTDAGQADAQADEAEVAVRRRLRLFWQAMGRLLRLLAELAQQQLPASWATGQHEPAIGLLLAWTRLLQQTREPLNRFDVRLTDHYYAQRLGFATRPAGADRVHLVLERDPRHPKPVHLPEGWRFVANLERGSVSYASLHALHLSPLKVSRLLTLRHGFDAQISPERDYGLATQALAQVLAVPTAEQAADPHAPSVPLLGGGPDSRPARQGLAIASPLLALREGLREIEVTLTVAAPPGIELPAADAGAALAGWCQRLQALEAQDATEAAEAPAESAAESPEALAAALAPVLAEHPGLRASPWLAFLLARCLATRDDARLRPRLGRLLAVWLCGSGPDLDAGAVAHLRSHLRGLGRVDDRPVDADDPLSLLQGAAPPERALVFDRVFRGAWRAELPGASGWLDLGEAFVRRAEGTATGGLVVSVQLTPDQPAVVAAREAVHGPGWPALPVLQLLLSRRSRLFASSLLQQLKLESAELTVAVHGARGLQLHNQQGRLDPGKPFMPLGPLPDGSAYLVFTHAELAAKPLEQLGLHLRWGGLPAHGLSRHYAAYPGQDWHEAAFQVRWSVLAEGRWQPAAMPPVALFGAAGQAEHRLAVDGPTLLPLHQPMALPPAPPGQPAEAPEFGLGSRQGFFKLHMAGPAAGFGHALYPRLIAAALTANSRLKPQQAQPLPEPPYTPVLESLTLDYRSRQRISARQAGGPDAAGELLHITPFGVQPLHRLPTATPVHLLQRWPGSGQLFIGLDGPGAEGGLGLLFHLRSEAAHEALGRPTPGLHWHAWCGQDWQPLEPHRVLLDSTDGMLRAGLVLLDLPAGLSRGCPAMPGDGFWLRLSGDGELDLLAGLVGVWTNGVCARRLGPPGDAPLPPDRIRAAQDATPGLATVRQPWPSFDRCPAESRAAWLTRVSERLRHRDRALSPWDCERLVLQAFPEVFKLKCIPRGTCEPDAPTTVVVVPALRAGQEIDGSEAPRLDASTLQRIAAYLADRMPPHQPLRVRNANYERIQVRGTLRLARGEPAGERLRELNQALRDYLSPWRPGGITTRFDWQLRADEVEAFLRSQPGVDAVGQVSLLHIVASDRQVYTLSDTARSHRQVRPAQAWSLALPTRGHLLDLADRPAAVAPASGLGKLTVASSFIIGRDAA